MSTVCSFHLRLICRSLDFDAAHALIRAFIYSRLDYCNSVLSGVPDYLLGRLHVLNSSARLLLQLPGRESVSIQMRNELHWLRFPQRITFKLCLLTFKALHDRSTWCDVAFGFHPTRVELVWGQLPPVNSSCREHPRKDSATEHSQAPDPSHGTACPV